MTKINVFSVSWVFTLCLEVCGRVKPEIIITEIFMLRRLRKAFSRTAATATTDVAQGEAPTQPAAANSAHAPLSAPAPLGEAEPYAKPANKSLEQPTEKQKALAERTSQLLGDIIGVRLIAHTVGRDRLLVMKDLNSTKAMLERRGLTGMRIEKGEKSPQKFLSIPVNDHNLGILEDLKNGSSLAPAANRSGR